MGRYWIETECFAAPIGELTPKQRACFLKWCTDEMAGYNKFIGRSEEEPACVACDYTQNWIEAEHDTRSEKIINFWNMVNEEVPFEVQNFSCTIIKILPEDVIKEDIKEFIPISFVKKMKRYEKTRNSTSLQKKNYIEKEDWNRLSTFLSFAEAARDNLKKSDVQDKLSPNDETKEGSGKGKSDTSFDSSELTPDKGEWVPSKIFRETNKFEGIKDIPSNRTLQDWRRQGKKNSDKTRGCDSQGYIWRKTPAKNKTEYWVWFESNEKSK